MSPGTQNVPVAARTADAFWRVPWEFAVHALVGTFIFSIIAAAAVLLDWGVGILSTKGVGRVIIVGLEGAEYGLFLIDLVLFGVFLWRTAGRTIKKL
jgi:hypothetical protein